MATRRYKINPGETEFQVISEVGAATNSDVIEVTIDLAALVTDGNAAVSPRTVEKDEVLGALDYIKNYILSHDWPPA